MNVLQWPCQTQLEHPADWVCLQLGIMSYVLIPHLG